MKNNFKLVLSFVFLGLIFLGNYNLTEAVTISGNTCTYKAEINTWSSCSSGTRYALLPGMVFATTTASSPTCVDAATVQACSQDVDGNDFGIINIGTQTWMADNLKTKHYTGGGAVDGGVVGYGNSDANINIYGGLYTYWVTNVATLCPTGWRVPKADDWTTLISYLGGVSSSHTTGLQYSIAGGKLKTVARGGTNDFGFSALGGGKWDSDYGWDYGAIWNSYWWVADSVYPVGGSYVVSMNDDLYSDSLFWQYPRSRDARMSVRCIKEVPYVAPVAETPTCYDSSATPTPKPLPAIDIDQTGLVAYYPFDGNANDAKSSINLTNSGVTFPNSTINNTFGNSAYFNGGATLYKGAVSGLSSTNYSVCTWYKQEANQPMQELISGREGPYSWSGLEIQTDGYNGNIRAGELVKTPIPDLGVWHQLCYTKQGTNSNFYLDGVSVSSSTVATAGVNPFPGSIFIGQDTYSYSVSGFEYFKGYMDDISFWSRGLSACEVKSLYSGTNACLTACTQPLTTTCSATSTSLIAPANITWTATSTSGVSTTTYSWSGTDGLLGTGLSITKNYTATGTKQAFVTVAFGNATTTISCPGTVIGVIGTTTTGGCTSNCGVTIIEPTENGSCVMGGTYMTAPTNPYLCLTGTSTAVSGGVNGPWTWSCMGSGPNHTDANDCTASKLNPLDSSLTCTLSAASSTVNVNTNTLWTASSAVSRPQWIKTRWSTGSATTTELGKTFNNIFTTIGLKTVTAEIASTTEGVFGPPCTATTTVVQSGGGTREI